MCIRDSFWTGDVRCWQWDQKANYTGGSWPGTDCRYVGTTKAGNKVYKWSWNKQTKPVNNPDAGIIFNCDNGSKQTANLEFVNGGYYDFTSGKKGVVTGIDKVSSAQTGQRKVNVYALDGRLVRSQVSENKSLQGLQKGVYVVNHRKLFVR